MHVALCEEALRGAAAALEDFGEVADGFRVEAGINGGEGGGAAAEEELNVSEELGDGFGLRGWGGGGVAGEEGVGEGEAVVGPANALSAEGGGG